MAAFVSSKTSKNIVKLRNYVKPALILKRNASSSKKIYELRTYSLKPECVKPFMELTYEKFHIRTQASKLNGYWAAELGGINQVVHIWEYDNYKHRAEVRAALASNKEWVDQYFGKILPMLTTQTNIGLISMENGSKEDIVYPDGQGVYELWSLNSSNFVGRGIKDLKSSLEAIQSDDTSSTLCGSFRSTFGPLGSIFFLWRHSDFDTAEQMRLLWLSNQGTNLENIQSFEVKGLVPLKISPML